METTICRGESLGHSGFSTQGVVHLLLLVYEIYSAGAGVRVYNASESYLWVLKPS